MLQAVDIQPQAEAAVALRVEVDQEGSEPPCRQPRRQVDGGDGLSNASLLVANGDGPTRPIPSGLLDGDFFVNEVRSQFEETVASRQPIANGENSG